MSCEVMARFPEVACQRLESSVVYVTLVLLEACFHRVSSTSNVVQHALFTEDGINSAFGFTVEGLRDSPSVSVDCEGAHMQSIRAKAATLLLTF